MTKELNSNTTEVVIASGGEIVARATSPLQLYAEKKIQEIQALNPGFKLDFLNVFTRLKTNKKGQFCYMLGDEEVNLSDEIKTRLLAGEPIYQLWGANNTDDAGSLVCYSRDHVTSVNGDVCAQCPLGHLDPNSLYAGKCTLRFAMILSLLEKGEDPTEVYNINVPTTATYAFADYIKLLHKKFKFGVQDVTTVLYTKEEKSKKDPSQSYNAIKFKYAGPLE